MSTSANSWGRHNLSLRKQEFGTQIQAFIKDQLSNKTLDEQAEVLEVSKSTVKVIRAGDFEKITLDTLYRVAMTLEMGPCVTIPQYGTYMG